MSIALETLVDVRRANFAHDEVAKARRVPVLQTVEALQEALTTKVNAEASGAAVGILWRACFADDGTNKQRRPDLDAASVGVVVKFIAEKTLDYVTADEAYKGLEALVEVFAPAGEGAMADDAAAALAGEWLPAAGVQRQSVAIRGRALRVVQLLLRHRLAAIDSTGGAFIRGFVDATEMEREPALVHLAFQLCADVTSRCAGPSVAMAAADLFDNVSAYFPVLFSPPPACTVTKAQLREALHAAMCHPRLLEHCLPFLCGKLSSASTGTKADVIDVLRRIFAQTAAQPDTIADVLPHLSDVLTGVRGEVLRLSALGTGEGDAELLQTFLGVLHDAGALVASLGTDDLLSALSPLLSGAVSTVESGSVSARAYATMLHAAASGAPATCGAVTGYLLPLLLGLATERGDSQRQREMAVTLMSAVLAANERCVSAARKAAGTSEPAPLAVPTKVLPGCCALLRAILESEDGEADQNSPAAAASSEAIVSNAIEATATLCALGHTDARWFSDSDAEAAYRKLASIAVNKATTSEATARRAARAAANAMRVDSVRGPAAFEAACCQQIQHHHRATGGAGADADDGDSVVDAAGSGSGSSPSSSSLAEAVFIIADALRGIRSPAASLASVRVLMQLLARHDLTPADRERTLAAVAESCRGGEMAADDAVRVAFAVQLLRILAGSTRAEGAPSVVGAVEGLARTLSGDALQQLVAQAASAASQPSASSSASSNSNSNSYFLSSPVVALVLGAALSPEQVAAATTGGGLDLAAAVDAVSATGEQWAALPHSARLVVGCAMAKLPAAARRTAERPHHGDAWLTAQLCKCAALAGEGAALRPLHDLLLSAVCASGDAAAGADRAAEAAAAVIAAPKPLSGTTFLWEQQFLFTTIHGLRKRAAASAPTPAMLRCLQGLLGNATAQNVESALSDAIAFALDAIAAPGCTVDAAAVLAQGLAVDAEQVLQAVARRPDDMVAIAAAGSARSGPMHTRAESFRLLAELARNVMDDAERQRLAATRDALMATVSRALDDPKRVVRQAAARCKHYWMLL